MNNNLANIFVCVISSVDDRYWGDDISSLFITYTLDVLVHSVYFNVFFLGFVDNLTLHIFGYFNHCGSCPFYKLTENVVLNGLYNTGVF